MTRNILLTSLFIRCTLCGTAQQMTEQDYIRSGNKFYADSLFEKAEVEYRKALEINSASTDALYNLGNALFNQIAQTPAKAGESLDQYKTAAKLETDKARLAQITTTWECCCIWVNNMVRVWLHTKSRCAIIRTMTRPVITWPKLCI